MLTQHTSSISGPLIIMFSRLVCCFTLSPTLVSAKSRVSLGPICAVCLTKPCTRKCVDGCKRLSDKCKLIWLMELISLGRDCGWVSGPRPIASGLHVRLAKTAYSSYMTSNWLTELGFKMAIILICVSNNIAHRPC